MAEQNQMSDLVVQMCQNAVADIIASVGGVGNLLQDDGKMALIQMIADRLTQLGADVNSILGTELAQAYFHGITDADTFMKTAGKDTTVTGVNKQMHLAGVQSIVADTMADMSASFRTALIMGVQDINGILDQVKSDIATGMIKGDPSGVTARLVEQSFAKSGMTSFVTKDGKRLPLDFYAQTVTRTKYRVAHTTGATNRYKESGVYHIKIDEHSPTCKVCGRYQGKVIALVKEHAQGFPVAGDDHPLPPYHPNCQHTARPFMMEYHSQADISNEKKKWNGFDPDQDTRSQDEKDFYKTEQDIRRKARQELKDYNQLKATLGDDAPKNIGAYRRAKRKNDDSWNALQTKYKEKMDAVNGVGPGPGTPKKKKGSKTGSATGSATPTKGKTKGKTKTPPPAPPEPVKPKPVKPKPAPPVQTKPVKDVQTKPKPPASHLTDADHKANAKFDSIIDGIEFGDMKKTANHILENSEYTKGSLTASVKTNIGCGGYCSPQIMMRKVYITDMVIEKNLYKFVPFAHQNQTIFHEFYHANMNRLPMPHAVNSRLGIGGNRWTSLEETATETAGIFMTNRAGINYHGEAPAYSNHLIDNLPRMKQMPEFAHCETLSDFGQVFMKYRFDPDHRTADWSDMDNRISRTKEHNTFQYIQTHYKQWVLDNEDMIKDKIFDTLSQQKAGKEDAFKQHIWKEIERGMNGKMNNFYQMAVGIAFNTPGMGVKLP